MSTDTATADETAPDTQRGDSGERKFVPASKAFGWDKGGLVIRSTEVLDRYNVAYLSPSTAKSMDGCPARWAAEKAMPEHEDPFGAAPLGTSAHSVMEELYQLPGRERTEDRAMNILLAHSKVMWPGKDDETMAKRGTWIAEVYNAYKGLFQIEDPTTVVVKQTEMQADGVEIGGVPFKGFIDRVDLTPDGVKVVDYKSGKVPQNIGKFGDDHGDQIRLYAHVIEAMTGETPSEGYLYYTRHAKARKVPLNAKVMREVLAKFQKSWTALNTYVSRAEFPTKTSALCGWCPLVNSCPSAQADGKEDRKGGAPSKTDLGIPVLRTFEAADLTVEARKQANSRKPSFDLDFGGSSTEPLVDPHDDIGAPPAIPDDPEDTPAVQPVEVTGSEPYGVPDALVDAVPGTGGQNDTQTGSAQPSAAHLTTDTSTTREMNNMTDVLLAEDKPWEETVNGALNPNSYAAGAVFGTVSLAYEEIVKADVKPSKVVIDALSQTFAHMVDEVQQALTGVSSWQDGSHTRLRGALRSYIAVNPIPFGGDRAAWDAWVETGAKHVKAISLAAVRLHETNIAAIGNEDPKPWASLAATEEADGFAA